VADVDGAAAVVEAREVDVVGVGSALGSVGPAQEGSRAVLSRAVPTRSAVANVRRVSRVTGPG
jgi:hypothetical protein